VVVGAVVSAVVRIAAGAVVGAALSLALLFLPPRIRPPSLSLAPSLMHVRPVLALSSVCGGGESTKKERMRGSHSLCHNVTLP
jgi:hypothetical protein